MKRLLKWIMIGLASLMTFTLLATGLIYALSNRAMNQQYDYPLTDFKVVSDSNLVVEGARLAKVHGCSNGCHGDGGKGRQWLNLPGIKVTTPNLPKIFNTYSDAQLERSIRGGVKADGTSALMMPSPTYYYLTDYDLSALIAYFRSLAPEAAVGPEAAFSFGMDIRYRMSTGDYRFVADIISQQGPRQSEVDTTNLLQFGHYLAETSCGGCHGADFMGSSIGSGPTPSLKVVAAYSEAEFDRFLTTGIAKGERETRMSKIALKSFSHLTANELDALYAYFSDFAKAPLEISEYTH
ncbi:MAG: c-type cytochrome [Bacteroidota bacterium]